DTNNYYPFGLNHIEGMLSTSNFGGYYSYKYNGKELQETGMYDYGARMYMPDVGRWGVIDPRSQYTHEAYSYVWNNPISFWDPTGMQGELAYPDRDGRKDGEFWKDSDGEFYWDAKNSVWKDFNSGESLISQVNLLGKSKDNNSGYAAATTLGAMTSESGVGLIILGVVGLAYIVDQATKPPLQWYTPVHTTIADPGIGYGSMNAESSDEDKDVNGVDVPNDSISGNENRKGGGKNGQHKNLKAKQSAGEKYQEAKAEYEKLRTKPNKSKEESKMVEKLKKQAEHWKRKADETGENHSRNAKGTR
ncbi:MAG: RHS repeat-associated core domain-containing protein, partial [Chryseobacterium culicis]